ncbi:MAG: hypothetical protein EXR93_12130 [Gemmatimonadetes bacterium]|nr:hypothetical protein [Gemmatimonadota bacterium]
MAEALGVIKPEHAKFIEKLTTLRNRLIHNVAQVSFDLSRYIEDGTAKADGLEAAMFALPGGAPLQAHTRQPRPLFWIHVVLVAITTMADSTRQRAEREIEAIRRGVGDELMKRTKQRPESRRD